MKQLEALIEELSQLESFDYRIRTVYNDLDSKKFRFKPLANYDEGLGSKVHGFEFF